LKIRLPSQKCFLTRKADDEAFADEQELQDFLSLLMRHWNSIGRKLEEDDVFTSLLFEDEKGEVLRLCWSRSVTDPLRQIKLNAPGTRLLRCRFLAGQRQAIRHPGFF